MPRTIELSDKFDIKGPDGRYRTVGIIVPLEVPTVSSIAHVAEYIDHMGFRNGRFLHEGTVLKRILRGEEEKEREIDNPMFLRNLNLRDFRSPGQYGHPNYSGALPMSGPWRRWGTDELDGYDLSSLRPYLEKLQANALRYAVVCEERLYIRDRLPQWNYGLSDGRLRLGNHLEWTTPGPVTFGPHLGGEGAAFIENAYGQPPQIDGEILFLDPAAVEDEADRVARVFAHWAVHNAEPAITTLSGDLVKAWRDVVTIAGGVAEGTGPERLGQVMDFVDRVLDDPSRWHLRHSLARQQGTCRMRVDALIEAARPDGPSATA